MIAQKKKNVKKWTSPHHQAVRYVLYPLIVFLVWILYGLKVTKFKEENNRQYLYFMGRFFVWNYRCVVCAAFFT